MKIDRLLGITIYLLNHGRTTAKKLSEHFEVSTRTIMRDVDTLCTAGIPISSNYGIDGGYEILETFRMNSQLAGADDYEYAVAALKGLSSAFTNKEIESTLEKVKSLSHNSDSALKMDLSAARENRSVDDNLHKLFNIIKSKKLVSFLYTNSKDVTKASIVEPIAVQYKWYNWYLIAFNREHQSYCMYKLMRMSDIQMLQTSISKEHTLAEAEVCMNDKHDSRELITILLKCNKILKTRCQEYLNGHVTKEYENGDFEYELTVPEEEQFWFGVLLSFGSEARVISPESLIDRIKNRCNELISLYK